MILIKNIAVYSFLQSPFLAAAPMWEKEHTGPCGALGADKGYLAPVYPQLPGEEV